MISEFRTGPNFRNIPVHTIFSSIQRVRCNVNSIIPCHHLVWYHILFLWKIEEINVVGISWVDCSTAAPIFSASWSTRWCHGRDWAVHSTCVQQNMWPKICGCTTKKVLLQTHENVGYIPSTAAALQQHVTRAVIHAGYIWAQSTSKQVIIPVATHWSWIRCEVRCWSPSGLLWLKLKMHSSL